MADPFVLAVRRALRDLPMLRRGQRVLVALSGGADSVALAAALAEVAKPLGLVLTAAHLNHALRREEADRDEGIARAVADGLGVDFVNERLHEQALAGRGGGLEQAARRARYAFLHRVALAHGCEWIATGHTRDDQAETLLLNLLRGSRSAGLRGIAFSRRDGVIRPLLRLRRSDTTAFVRRRGLRWAEDSSNRNPAFRRNRIRMQILPALAQLNPQIVEHLGRLADSFAEAAAAEDFVADALLRQARDPSGALGVEALRAMPLSVRRLVLRRWLGEGRGDLRRIGARHLESLAGAVDSNGAVQLPGGGVAACEGGLLRLGVPSPVQERAAAFLQAGARVAFGSEWTIEATLGGPVGAAADLPSSLLGAVFDAELVAFPLCIRAWRAGDRVRPLNMRGSRKLSDVFVDRKIPRRLRSTLPVIETRGEVLWVPGVVRADHAKITPATLRVVRLRAAESGARRKA